MTKGQSLSHSSLPLLISTFLPSTFFHIHYHLLQCRNGGHAHTYVLLTFGVFLFSFLSEVPAFVFYFIPIPVNMLRKFALSSSYPFDTEVFQSPNTFCSEISRPTSCQSPAHITIMLTSAAFRTAPLTCFNMPLSALIIFSFLFQFLILAVLLWSLIKPLSHQPSPYLQFHCYFSGFMKPKFHFKKKATSSHPSDIAKHTWKNHIAGGWGPKQNHAVISVVPGVGGLSISLVYLFLMFCQSNHNRCFKIFSWVKVLLLSNLKCMT